MISYFKCRKIGESFLARSVPEQQALAILSSDTEEGFISL